MHIVNCPITNLITEMEVAGGAISDEKIDETSKIFFIHFIVICSQANLLLKARLQFDTYGII